MNSFFPRRDFLRLTLAAGAGALAGRMSPALFAIEPIQRTGPPRFPLSLAAYSFRQFFKDGNRREEKAAGGKQIDLFDFLDYCAEQGLEGAELTSYYFPAKIDDALLRKIKRHAFLKGVEISGTAVGNTFTLPEGDQRKKEIAHVKTWVDYASIMGAPHIRVFAGNAAKGQSAADAQKLCIAALEECCAYAGEKGVFLGIENHGGIVAEAGPLLEIVKAVQSPWVGINLDTGNFHTADPYGDIEKCVPYAVNVQIKVEISARGKSKEATDIPKLFEILRRNKYQGYVALEYEAAEDPWKAVPPALAAMKKLARSS